MHAAGSLPLPVVVVGVQWGPLERWLEDDAGVRVVATVRTTGSLLTTVSSGVATGAIVSWLLDGDPPLRSVLQEPIWAHYRLLYLSGPWSWGRDRLAATLPPGATVLPGRWLQGQRIRGVINSWTLVRGGR